MDPLTYDPTCYPVSLLPRCGRLLDFMLSLDDNLGNMLY